MASKIETAVTVLVAVSVILIIIDYVYELSTEQRYFIYVFDIAIVGVLIADFYRRLRASGQRYGHFILRHWYEIPAMLPVVVFALLETHTVIGAAMRGTGLIPIFRILRLFHRTTTIFKESKVAYLIAFSAGSIIIGAFAEFIVESPHPDSKITNFGDALWWAMVTVTTVGYGDVYPVTVEGKIIAAFLMVVGIGVLGIFISTFGAALIESRLRMKKSSSAVEDKLPNLEEMKPDTGTSIVHTTNFNVEAKNFIKQKVDEIEKMNEKEINMLIDMIRTIHNSQANTNNDNAKTDVDSSTR
jgi:voltage-gated potassium channel